MFPFCQEHCFVEFWFQISIFRKNNKFFIQAKPKQLSFARIVRFVFYFATDLFVFRMKIGCKFVSNVLYIFGDLPTGWPFAMNPINSMYDLCPSHMELDECPFGFQRCTGPLNALLSSDHVCILIEANAFHFVPAYHTCRIIALIRNFDISPQLYHEHIWNSIKNLVNKFDSLKSRTIK